MKKTIKILVEKMEKLQEMKDGVLHGGFASVKGGFSAVLDSTNDGVNCTNSHDCTKSTNTLNCSNGICFM